MIDKIAAFFGFEEESSTLAPIIAPLFLISTILLAAKEPSVFNYDLLFIAVFGLFLTAKWKTRGCIAALLLLAFSAGAKHVLVPHTHAWQAGLEGSIGIAFLISALVSEETSKSTLSRQNEIERNEKTILFLEEDLSQQKEVAAKESAAAAEKCAAIHLQVEESNSEISQLLVLNDVLRKTTAKSIEEKESLLLQTLQFDRREGQLLEEIDSLQKELSRLANESALVQQNKQLFNELNETRVKEAQTHLINETLVRLHAKENLKAREFEARFLEMEEEIQNASFEKANAHYEIEKLSSEAASLRERSQYLEDVQSELRALRELVAKLEQELDLSQQKPALSKEERESLMSQLETHQTRLQQYAQMELLYRQLKVQFEEKNQILHQTRSELFHTDTELQTIKQKIKEKDLEYDPLSKEVYREIEAIEAENRELLGEALELQDLVSHLTQRDGFSQSVKKNEEIDGDF